MTLPKLTGLLRNEKKKLTAYLSGQYIFDKQTWRFVESNHQTIPLGKVRVKTVFITTN